MSLRTVPNREERFEQPSDFTLNVGAPTFCSSASDTVARPFRGEVFQYLIEVVPMQGKPSGLKGLSYKPSEITLNVGAPTFLTAHPVLEAHIR